ncbi:energy-coupling factor ABC transporter permease [Chitinilyticum piscinae]|uniref:Energy-coupling factor ABC transporter permease n=1 Tax=Chitinilyticum piscinae TaxID=2866724 RepID=A0A8J7G0G8_9NEIS|nr:energy-coupling factor ABC transporter permease [Chitinilyticum piscinae]MBE9609710.1 energy-coupling factor ABC transporter permease [Chitinilyticum piscinae]
MNLLAAPFPEEWLWLASAIAALLLLRAGMRIRWLQLSQPELSSWFGATTLILLLWQLQASVTPGIAFHLLGATALMLIAGRDRALFSMLVIIVVDALWQGHGDAEAAGLSWLIAGWVPVTLSHYLLQLSQRRLPCNFFIYIFLNSFAAGALCIWTTGLLQCLALAASPAFDLATLLDEQFPYFFMLGFPEAFTTGLNITILVIWRPQWVASFDDQRYLGRN